MRILFAVLLLLMIGCQSAPSVDNYLDCIECYYNADCLYRNKDNLDKSSCSGLEVACTDALKEKRIKARITYCTGSTKPADWSFKECMLTINQK